MESGRWRYVYHNLIYTDTDLFDILQHRSTEISLDTFFRHGRMLDRCGSGKAFVRGLPIDTDIVNHFNASALAYVRTLLQALGGCISYEDSGSVPEGAKDAHYLGWVVLRDSVASSIAKVYFPSALHRSQISWLLDGRFELPAQIEAMSLQDFIFTAVESFSRMALLSAERHPNAHGQPSIPEGLYRNELYRAAYEVTGGRGIWLSPEFGTERLSMKTEGVDFFVAKSKGWAIEVLREGDQISEHLKRFEPSGAYYSWILQGVIEKYIVVDFHPNDQHPKHDIPGMFHPHAFPI